MAVSEEKLESLRALELTLGKRILGQGRAIASVASKVRRAELGFSMQGKPLGSFLFLGPTGVGKTQLAKELSELVGEGDESLHVLDMSEYQDGTASRRLLGTARAKGRFHELSKPKLKVVVFDEIEKAYRPALDLLHQILDEGRITLGDGQLISFENCYVVLTSNLAAEGILKAQSGSQSSLDRYVRNQALRFLRPDLLGRIDLVEVFQPLSYAQRVEIGRLIACQEVARLLALGEPAENVVGDTLLAMCAKDCDLGVRPLKRKIDAIIQEALVQKRLAGPAA